MRSLYFSALFLASSLGMMASTISPISPCAAGDLTSYANSYPLPGSTGCSIGILDYSNFSYHAISNAPGESSILLTPDGQGFSFTQVGGAPFIATAGETVQFEIDYNILIDPAPVIAGANNRLDPTGYVTATEYFCNDSIYYFSGVCYGSKANPIDSLSVGTSSTPYPLSASITFRDPAQSFQTVGILFTLEGPASFDGLVADTTVINAAPEPTSLLLVGLLFIGGSYKLRQWSALRRS